MLFYNIVSKFFGAIAKYEFPKMLQTAINRWYVRHFNIDMSEFWHIQSYKSLNALFTREFITPRQFNNEENAFISPCDGTCLSFGKSVGDMAFSVKGQDYSLSELLGGAMSSYELKNGYDFANIYLSPRDYHHYHAPCDMQIIRALHIPGGLYSVAVKWLRKVDSLYIKNERVVLECVANNLKLWLVFVGALNVGKMNFCFDKRIKTNATANQMQTYNYDELFVKKGDRLGNFELGSTIVIVSENGLLNYDLDYQKPLKFGQKIATF